MKEIRDLKDLTIQDTRPFRSARMRAWSAECHHGVSNNASCKHAHAHQTTRARDGPEGRVRARSERHRESQSGRLRDMCGRHPGEIGIIWENLKKMREMGECGRNASNPGEIGRIRESSGRNAGDGSDLEAASQRGANGTGNAPRHAGASAGYPRGNSTCS